MRKYTGECGWFEGSLGDFFDSGAAQVSYSARSIIIRAPINDTQYQTSFPADSTSVEIACWESEDGEVVGGTIQHFRDAAGSLIVSNWKDADHSMSLLWVRTFCARNVIGRAKASTIYGDGRLFDASVSVRLDDDVEPLHLRMTLKHGDTPYEVDLRNTESTAWVGYWVIPPDTERGPVRGRLLECGSDRFFLGTWEEDGIGYAFFVTLRPT